MTRTYRPEARPESNDELTPRVRTKRTKGLRPSPLVTLHASVRSLRLTAQGDFACTLDTPAGRLRVFGDAAAVHLPELAVGRRLQVVLLRLRRVTEDVVCQWQLLGCRAPAQACAQQAGVHALTEGRSA